MRDMMFKRMAAVLTLALSAGAAHAAGSPDETLDRYLAAVNAGDMQAVRALIATDVDRSDFVGCRPEMDNPACLAYYIETTVIKPKARLAELRRQVDDSTITAWLEMRSGLTAKMGVERVLGRDVMRVSGGLIRSFRFVPDFDDEQTAVFFGKLGIGPRAMQYQQQPSKP